MSIDALLWICTLLFAATMLILSAMRHAEAAGASTDMSPGGGTDVDQPRSLAKSVTGE
jgi:glucosamine 6-phosphate synthetase-like amidotransferase/phosphosugar isomerase protein